jgi:type I restriction enzyme, S subunit
VKLGYKQTEVGVIPEEWEVITLGELSEFVTSGSRGWASYYSNSGALFVRSQNVRDGRLDFTDCQMVNPPRGAEDTTSIERPADHDHWQQRG